MTDDHVPLPAFNSPSLNPPPLVPSSSTPPSSTPRLSTSTPPSSPPITPTFPPPFTDPTSARYADEFLRLAPADPKGLGIGDIRRSIQTAVGNSQGYIIDPYTQSGILSIIDYLARESTTFRRMYAFTEHPPAAAPFRPLALEQIVFTTLSGHDGAAVLHARNWADLYKPFARPGHHDSTAAYINIAPAPNVFTNPNEWFAWARVLVHELVHLMTSALDPLLSLRRQELGPAELITNEIFGELSENLTLPRYAYTVPGIVSHVAVLNHLGYEAARNRTPFNEFDLRFLTLQMPRARRDSNDSITLGEIRVRPHMIDASTRHMVENGTERLRVNNQIFPETRVSVTQGSTGAHPVVTVDNVHIEANGETRRGSLRLEYVGEFDLRESLVEVGGNLSDFPYGFHVEAGNRNLQAFFVPDAGAREPAPPGVYVRRDGRWQRCTMRAGALPTESPRNDTEYGKSFFTAVQRKFDTEAPTAESTAQHYSDWLDKLGLKPVKSAFFWLKHQFEYFVDHYPINRLRRTVMRDPGLTLSPSEMHSMAHDIFFRVSDKVNVFFVTNTLRAILQNTSIWTLSPREHIEHYYNLGRPNYLYFRSNHVDGFLAISLMAYNFSNVRYADIFKPSFEPYKHLTRNTLVLMNPERDETIVFDDTAGKHGKIERRYNVAMADNPAATTAARKLVVSAPNRVTLYQGYFFMRGSDLTTVLFHVLLTVRPDPETGESSASQPDYLTLTPQVGGRGFVPYLRAYLEMLEQSTVICDDMTGRLLLRLEMQPGHSSSGTHSQTLLIPEPCDIRHHYKAEHNEQGYLIARYKVLSLTYARVFTMQYSLNIQPGFRWTRQPTVWPVALRRPDGTAYAFEDVLTLPLAHQIAGAVVGIAAVDRTEMEAPEATWIEWRRTFVNLQDMRHTYDIVSALGDRPSVIRLRDHSCVILLQDRDIYDLGLLGDVRLNFRNYREGCLALYVNAGGYVVAWDRMGVSFDPSLSPAEQAQTVKIETDYLVQPRSSADDVLSLYSSGSAETLYAWKSVDSTHPILITAEESLTKTYNSDSRYEIIREHAKALVDQWLQKVVGENHAPENQFCILQALANTDGVQFDMNLDESNWNNDSYPHKFTYTVPDRWPEGLTTLQGVFHKAAEDFYTSAYNNIYPKEGAINIDRIALSLHVLVKRSRSEEATRVCIGKT